MHLQVSDELSKLGEFCRVVVRLKPRDAACEFVRWSKQIRRQARRRSGTAPEIGIVAHKRGVRRIAAEELGEEGFAADFAFPSVAVAIRGEGKLKQARPGGE